MDIQKRRFPIPEGFAVGSDAKHILWSICAREKLSNGKLGTKVICGECKEIITHNYQGNNQTLLRHFSKLHPTSSLELQPSLAPINQLCVDVLLSKAPLPSQTVNEADRLTVLWICCSSRSIRTIGDFFLKQVVSKITNNRFSLKSKL